MIHKASFLLFSVLLGLSVYGALYFVTADTGSSQISPPFLSSFSGAYQSFLETLAQRNKKDEQRRFIDRVESFEDEVHPYHDILANDQYDKLLSYILAECPEKTAELGQLKFNDMRMSALQVEKVMQQSLGVRVLLSAEKFEKITAQRPFLKELDIQEYCTQKYASILYQKRLSQRHIELVLTAGILRDQQIKTPERVEYVYQQKKNILSFIENRDRTELQHLQISNEHGSAPEIDEENLFVLDDQNNPLEKLTEQQKSFAEVIIALGKTKVIKMLSLLQEMEILTQEDRMRILSNIKFVIPESCNQRDAYYLYLEQNKPYQSERFFYKYLTPDHVVSIEFSPETKDIFYEGMFPYKKTDLLPEDLLYKDGKIIKFQGLSFSIPICDNYQNLMNFSSMLEYTILHELGHYYMHRRDPFPEIFASFCREKEEINICNKEDFVTPYAMSSAREDYAETFANVLYTKINGYAYFGEIQPAKKQYFLHQFGLSE